MIITTTCNPGAGANTHSSPGNISKSDKQHVQKSEYNLARKRKIKTAIDATINQIDDIIKGLATKTGIGFTKACNYVHLGRCIFKGYQCPTIQNAY